MYASQVQRFYQFQGGHVTTQRAIYLLSPKKSQPARLVLYLAHCCRYADENDVIRKDISLCTHGSRECQLGFPLLPLCAELLNSSDIVTLRTWCSNAGLAYVFHSICTPSENSSTCSTMIMYVVLKLAAFTGCAGHHNR